MTTTTTTIVTVAAKATAAQLNQIRALECQAAPGDMPSPDELLNDLTYEDAARWIADLEQYIQETQGPQTMPCSLCPQAQVDHLTGRVANAPEREVVREGVAQARFDPTAYFVLACGHTII